MQLNQMQQAIEPKKWDMIIDIRDLAESYGLMQYCTMEGICEMSRLSFRELFLMKYELRIMGMNLMDFLINFRYIGISLFLSNYKLPITKLNRN